MGIVCDDGVHKVVGDTENTEVQRLINIAHPWFSQFVKDTSIKNSGGDLSSVY